MDRQKVEDAEFVFEKVGDGLFRCLKARYGDATVGNRYPDAVVEAIASQYETVVTDEETAQQPQQLAEVIPFPSANNELAAQLSELATEALAGGITGYVIAFKRPDGAIFTQHGNADLAERTVLAQHLQFDVIDAYIDEKLSD